MYVKITNQLIGQHRYHEAIVLDDTGESSIYVKFKDWDGYEKDEWIMRPKTGKTCGSFFDYELIEDLPRGAMAVAHDGWVEYEGAGYFHDWSGDLSSAPIISATYEPDWPMETKVVDFAEPISNIVADQIMALIR